MKKTLLMIITIAMLVSSCGSAGEGAMTGASFGSILGSAIGGITGGWRGHDVGAIVGMAAGAATGAAIGAASEQNKEERIERYHERVERREHRNDGYISPRNQQNYDESGFDATNSGDDRLYDFQSSDYTGDYSASTPKTVMPEESGLNDRSYRGYKLSSAIEIQNARFVDANNNGVLERGEQAKVIFEIRNVSDQMLRNIVPTVVETTGNKSILVSGSIHVESLPAGKAVRYTAVVLAKKNLKNGVAKFALSVYNNGSAISKVTEFEITTSKNSVETITQ